MAASKKHQKLTSCREIPIMDMDILRMRETMRRRDLTTGNITKNLMLFPFPMMAGNFLQQCYNIADTLIVGRYLGANALAAVGSSYTLMTFLTSILLGMCMGSGAVFSIRFGEKDCRRLKEGMVHSFGLIAAMTLVINILVFAGLPLILRLLQVPAAVVPDMRAYLQIIFIGISAAFLYNYFAAFLRAIGNSVVPLAFLGISALLNIVLDLAFIILGGFGVAGAAVATVIAQFVSGVGIAVFTVAMAAFAAAVKIDSFAYMPVQDFGNAFSTFIAQNFGAGKEERIRRGIKSAVLSAFFFCIVISGAVCLFARPLMQIFVKASETEIITIGVEYLRIEGAFYFGIGLLFLLYGYYRAVKKPGMSVILTIVSLGTRVLLAYTLSAVPSIGVKGIWVSVPIGWVLADALGVIYYFKGGEKT